MNLNKEIAQLNAKVSLTKVLDHFDISYDAIDDRFRIECPFHEDDHPSLIIYTDNDDGRDSFWCPPCDQAGDAFLFIRLMIKKKRDLSTDSKSDFAESLEVLRKLSGVETRILNLKETILEKLNNNEEPLKSKNTEKKFLYMCGVIIRDAVEQKRLTTEEAEKIFRIIDSRLEKNELDKAEETYQKIRKLVQKRSV